MLKRTVLLIILASVLPFAAPPAGAAEFPRPDTLEPAVTFWREVFLRWDRDQIVYLDGYDLDRVYEIRRLPPADGTRSRERDREHLRADWKRALADDLESLAAPGTDYDRLEGRRRRLYLIWDEARDPAVYRAAAENLRSQRGIREDFTAGVARSARYLDDFRRIFREEGVPEDLVYLPHVESSYRPDARSSVGALGMWQFMSATARRYMLVTDAVDERLDPHTAARAAARYLKEAHAELGTWPLAVTSYNHGVDGIKNAVTATGSTDIAAIIATYRGPLFGFAGRNFYPELLAARDASEALLAEPGSLPLDEPRDFEEFPLPAFVKLSRLAGALGVSRDALVALNPALTRTARDEMRYLPKGFRIKLPPGHARGAGSLFAALPASDRPLTEPPRTYRVRSGDTLGGIAGRFKTTTRALQRLNGIRNPNHLRAGALLKLPH